MKKTIILSESDLVILVKKILKESETEYVILGDSDHLMGKGMFIYTGDGEYSLIPKTIEFRRRMEVGPHIFNNRKECEKVIKLLRKERRDIHWYIEIL